jgi:VWFA-related protein
MVYLASRCSLCATKKEPGLKFKRWSAAIVLPLSVIGRPMYPQVSVAAEQAPTAQLTVSARIVLLDAVVTDRKGKVVSEGLTRDDFKVLEDGQPQSILNFEAPAQHAMPPGSVPIVNSAADLKRIGNAPVTILVLDELNSRFEDSSYSRQMLLQFLKAQPPVLREPMVLMVAENSTFQQIHDYTQNRDALMKAITSIKPEVPWRLANGGKNSAGAVERMAQVLAALQQLAQASHGTPGRKDLIWLGNGFPSADLVGLDERTSTTIHAAFRRCMDQLMDARITLYSVNPTANSTETIQAMTPDDLSMGQDSNGNDPFASGTVAFPSLAQQTGGIGFGGRNDLNNVIAEGIARGEAYYTLSYRPTGSSEEAARFRNIRIVMKDPSLHATTRAGYYPDSAADLNPVVDKSIPPAKIAENLKLDLSNALISKIAYNGLAVTASSIGEGRYAIQVAENGMGWSSPDANGSEHAEATVAAAWYDSKDKLLGHVAREETYPRDEGSRGARFLLPVELPKNAARLRIVVRDGFNGHMGTYDITKF